MISNLLVERIGTAGGNPYIRSLAVSEQTQIGWRVSVWHRRRNELQTIGFRFGDRKSAERAKAALESAGFRTSDDIDTADGDEILRIMAEAMAW